MSSETIIPDAETFDPPVVLRIKDVSSILNVSMMTTATYLRNGLIPARKIGGVTIILRDEFLASLKNLPRAEYMPPYEPKRRKRAA